MSVNVRRLGEALTLYADSVEVAGTDLDEKHHQLQSRLDQAPRRNRGPLLLAAAVLVVLAAVVAGMLSARQPETTVPASPQGSGSLTGLWRYNDGSGGTLFVIGRDGSLVEHTTMTTLLRGAGNQRHRIVDDGQRIVVSSADPQGRPCRSQPIVTRSDGRITLGQTTVDAPGCLISSGAEAILTRLSPNPADLPSATEGPTVPVSDPVQLDGVWILSGTSTVLGVDEIGGPARYLLDRDGDLQPTPDVIEDLSVRSDGAIVLVDAACGDTTLRRAQVQGRGVGQVLTAVVDIDPCRWFVGPTTQTWIRVF